MGIYAQMAKRNEKTGLNQKIAELLDTLNKEEPTVVTYYYLAVTMEKPQLAINSAIKAMDVQHQALVVDRDTKVPGLGFWGMRADEMRKAGMAESEIEEKIDAKHAELVERHADYRLEDVERKAKATKQTATQNFLGF